LALFENSAMENGDCGFWSGKSISSWAVLSLWHNSV